MRVTPLAWTPNPEVYVAMAARNDYMTDFIGDALGDTDAWDPGDPTLPPGLADVLGGVSDGLVDDADREWAREQAETESESVVTMYARLKAFVEMLLRHEHFGPFEHPHAVFAVEGISRVCMAQITRHRLASFDIQSYRYTQPDGDALLGISADWADRWPEMREYVVTPRVFEEYGPDDDSEGVVYEQVYLQHQLDAYLNYLEAVEWARDHGAPESRAKEDARYLLPQGAKVNMVVSTNLRQFLHIADMRAAGDAHYEIRDLTEQVLDYVESWAPITMAFYDEHMRNRKNRLAP